MSTALTAGQRALMQANLLARRTELERQIAQQLGGRSRPEHAREVLLQAGDSPAHDADREVDLARSDREIDELRAVNEALVRLEGEDYGLCDDCGEAIPFDRLQGYPQALRCVACQSAFEARHGLAAHRPTL